VEGAEGACPAGRSADSIISAGALPALRSRGLRETLKRNGIESIDPKGEKFDPNRHEALSTMPAEGVESGTVVEVMQKGYVLNEQVIRPARVVVSA